MFQETKEDQNKWKDIPWSWIRRLNIVKVSTLPKMIDSFNATPIRISADFFVEINKLIQKFMWKCKGPRIAKMILQKNNQVRGFTFPDFNSYKAAAIKIMRH